MHVIYYLSQVMAEIAVLEEELETRHKEELANLKERGEEVVSGVEGEIVVERRGNGEGVSGNMRISDEVGKDSQDTEVTGDSLEYSGLKEEPPKKSKTQKRKVGHMKFHCFCIVCCLALFSVKNCTTVTVLIHKLRNRWCII